MTDDERRILVLLGQAQKLFSALPGVSAAEADVFGRHHLEMQNIVVARIGWRIIAPKKEG